MGSPRAASHVRPGAKGDSAHGRNRPQGDRCGPSWRPGAEDITGKAGAGGGGGQ